MIKYLVSAALILAAHSAMAAEAYCTKFGNGISKPIEKVCKQGDIIEVSSVQILKYCDFSKQIFKTSGKERYVCQYLGYVRELRSRADGKLSPFITEEK